MKLFNKYNKLPLPAKASLWFILTSILQNGISFITVPFFTRLLSPEEFGLINVYQSWLSILTIFATLTLWGGVFNNGMVKYDKDRDVFLSSLQGLSTTLTISLFLVFLIFSDIISKLFKLPILLITLMFIQIMFTPSLNLWSAKQRFDYKYRKLVLITIIMSIANPILGIILVLISENGGIARIYSIVLIQISIGFILYIKNLKSGKKFFHKPYWKYAVTFNIPLIPHYLSQSILNQADRIMINNMVGTDKAGIYSVSYSVGMIFIFVVTSINSTFTPWTYKKLKEKSYEAIEKTSYFLLILLSALILLLISFAPEIIILMAPPEYSEAIWVVPPITLSIYFIFLYGLFANIEFYFEENRFIMLASVMAALLNIILNLLLIPIFGYLVAGYTTLISYIIYSFAHYIFMCKVLLKYNVKETIYKFNKIIVLGTVLIGSALLIMLTYELHIIRYFIIAMVVGIILFNRRTIIKKIELLKQ
jgi:O-antigen/teichoic acid export membrane protein